MVKRGSIIILFLVILLTGGIYLVFLLTPEPPLENFENARKAIAEAKKQGAEKYAAELFASSENAFHDAVKLLKAENERFILFRDYGRADSTCEVAIARSEVALTRSLANSRKLEESLSARIKELNILTDRYSQWMNFLPVKEVTRKKFLSGKMKLLEASIDFENQKLVEGDLKTREAAIKLNESVDELKGFLEQYFKHFPEWTGAYQAAVEKSRITRSNLIVIDKMARTCKVYKNGKLKKTYPVELGRNWIGDKRKKGDKSTPEGQYHVVKKLDQAHTKYYKALLINYPNEDDQLRFARDKQNGTLPGNADIGGLIEIHGHGGKGADWTDGCIALEDEDMKDLFSQAGVSTPVTIVGSLVPLNELIKK